jgi:hypothetical protein
MGVHPVIDIHAYNVVADSATFLNLAFRLFAASNDLVEIVIRKMTPLLLGLALQLLPIFFDAFRSAADLATDPILLLVQPPLFCAGDMALVLCGHEAFHASLVR